MARRPEYGPGRTAHNMLACRLKPAMLRNRRRVVGRRWVVCGWVVGRALGVLFLRRQVKTVARAFLLRTQMLKQVAARKYNIDLYIYVL